MHALPWLCAVAAAVIPCVILITVTGRLAMNLNIIDIYKNCQRRARKWNNPPVKWHPRAM
jgi:hypothetical protein